MREARWKGCSHTPEHMECARRSHEESELHPPPQPTILWSRSTGHSSRSGFRVLFTGLPTSVTLEGEYFSRLAV